MARVCIVCNKQTQYGKNVSHSNVKTRRAWAANLQRMRVVTGGAPQRVYVCAKCLKSGKVARA